MPFADVNGQNIHYQDTGGDGPAILLSHGFGMGHEMWVHQIEPLTGAGWRVVTYDERGWGQTTHTEPFDYWGLAADLSV
jgi:pimeloyl-ACP methyl ester carboxylesterase